MADDSVASAHAAPVRARIRVLVLMEAREFGGPAKNLIDTITVLAGQVDFHVGTFIRGTAPVTEFTSKLEQAGVRHSVIREGFRYDPRGMTALRKVVNDYRPHIVQIHNNKSRFYVYLLQKVGALNSLQTIDCYHGETWTNRTQLVYNQLDRWLFRRAQHIVVVSKTQEELLASFGVPRHRVTVVYNGIHVRPSCYRPANGDIRVVTIGRLSKEKGHAVLIAAIRLLVEDGATGFTVTIVGDGPEMNQLRMAAAAANLESVIAFVGYQNQPTPYYENADIFVLPSLSEGIPNVLLEAAIHHVPIVTTSIGGTREMFSEENEAIFVQPNDAVSLATGLKRVLGDESLRARLAMAARARVEKQFTRENRAQRYLEYYQALVNV